MTRRVAAVSGYDPFSARLGLFTRDLTTNDSREDNGRIQLAPLIPRVASSYAHLTARRLCSGAFTYRRPFIAIARFYDHPLFAENIQSEAHKQKKK